MQADRLARLQTFGAYVGKLVSTIVLIISLAFQLVVVTAAAAGVVALFGASGSRGAKDT